MYISPCTTNYIVNHFGVVDTSGKTGPPLTFELTLLADARCSKDISRSYRCRSILLRANPYWIRGDDGSGAATINDWGQIAGVIADGPLRYRGYLLEVDGTITVFGAPSANNSPTFVTLPAAINDLGEMIGYFQDLVGWHGFVRERKGSFVVFDAGSGDTFPLAINQGGENGIVVTLLSSHCCLLCRRLWLAPSVFVAPVRRAS